MFSLESNNVPSLLVNNSQKNTTHRFDEIYLNIRKNKTWPFNITKHNLAQSQNVLNNIASSNIALQTDNDPTGNDDHVCCAQLTPNPTIQTTGTAGLDQLDSPNKYSAVWQLLNSNNSNVYIAVATLDPANGRPIGGRAESIPGSKFVVNQSISSSTVMAHEWGHCLGLQHSDAPNSNHIMYEMHTQTHDRVTTEVKDTFEGNP